MKRLLPVFLVAGLVACSAPPPDSQTVVDRAIAFQGGELLNNAEMTFDFRGRAFRVRRQNGLFEYERTWIDTTGAQIRDLLTNDGLVREVDGQVVELDSAAYRSAETGVNSVVYFALLPLPLNDPAAQKTLLGTSEMDGRAYHELEVTFRPEGGGRDYDDRFVFWINQDTGAMDFLAYYFHVDDGGSRFRQAYNLREISGVRVSDHRNFRGDGMGIDRIQDYDSLYAAGALEAVSDVELENVVIRLLD